MTIRELLEANSHRDLSTEVSGTAVVRYFVDLKKVEDAIKQWIEEEIYRSQPHFYTEDEGIDAEMSSHNWAIWEYEQNLKRNFGIGGELTHHE